MVRDPVQNFTPTRPNPKSVSLGIVPYPKSLPE
jgi:hypothetical protein